ncbi:D-amino acid dehydrogenase [Burkholderia oklahomensis]|uniref:Ketopantoate reductase PanE/ApbA family protein n=1 Tax=Burkholderia oklahomensis TaxID=342113 RepID=A0AAI8BC22_9BURK|nr:D-amino acid dehydrogenase [Burkholderia oklahomensis]AIO69299.1 ketopantoate reductase PanE/ApbA family protein [Burkholderia oklahomensis]AOI38309.1 amino acid dehydrogenase [Burkholderia oklahomensis EO147]KUY48568.1 amino acid dehydrogenase [Burkholderia oklahomensis EO147]QPS41714.1 D-amino acid dehydrogenase [Burkholderia oklahomensis]
MRICVLGAGVVGLTTAYHLAREGHDVTVLEARSDAMLDASFANGGQLSYSYVAPLADPAVLSKLPAWLVRTDSALRFVPRLDAGQWLWCIAFLAACRTGRARRTAAEMLELGALSRAALHDLVEREALDFDYARNGKLVVYRDRQAFDQAQRAMEHLINAGAQQQALDAAACVALEPALAHAGDRLAGGIHTPSEEVGDCRRFGVGLARVLRGRLRVAIHYETPVDALRVDGARVVAARTARGDIDADAFVLSAGNGSAPMLRGLGLRLPIYPLTGYSLTLPGRQDQMPRVSVTDLHRKIVYAPLGSRLRIAGMVEIAGIRSSGRERRLALLARQAQEIFPHAGDYANGETWCGHRPATPDGKPLIGATRFRNLWLNTGHGSLGFTLACGSARVVADLIAGREPALDARAYAPNR